MKKLFTILVIVCATLMVSCGSNSVEKKALYFAELMAEAAGSETKEDIIGEQIERYLETISVEERLQFEEIFEKKYEDILSEKLKDILDDAEPNVKKSGVKQGASTKVYSNCYDGYLNVRAQPSSNSDIVCKMSNGPEGAELLSTEGKWSLVRINGIVGYAWSAYLQSTPTEPVYISSAEVVGNWFGDASGTLTINKNGKFAHRFGASATMSVVENGSWRLSRNKLILRYSNGETTTCTVSGKRMVSDDEETFTRI